MPYLKEMLIKLEEIKHKIKLNKIKNLEKQRYLLFVSVSILTSLLIVSFLHPNLKPTKVSNLNSVFSAAVSPDDLRTIGSKFKYVDKYEVQNAKATVIFVPQIHKEPTTNASDPKNDQAVVIQKEISSILNKIVNENKVSYVMDETDLYGPMPSAKIEKIKKGLAEEDQVKSEINDLIASYLKSGGSEASANQIRKQVDSQFGAFERNIYLTGGAAVLAAENPNANVYGSQNAVTINEAKKQLQNIVFMEDRVTQLGGTINGSSGTTNTSSQVNTSQDSEIQQLLSLLGSSSNSGNSLDTITQFAKGQKNDDLMNQAQKSVTDLNNLLSKKNFEAFDESSASAVAAPVNPYAKANNLKELQSEYNAAYDNFMKLAKDQRSQEVADNMEKMMADNGQKTGILVLGAQHKDELVSAFNKKGINVIVVTPETERDSSQLSVKQSASWRIRIQLDRIQKPDNYLKNIFNFS